MDNHTSMSETQQLKSAIQYIIIGFLFASLTIDIGWIPEIEGLISVLWFFIGLRMTKGLNWKFKYAYYLAVSKYFVFNVRQPLWYRKREGQVFVETWHGTPLKRLVFDQEEETSASPRCSSIPG